MESSSGKLEKDMSYGYVEVFEAQSLGMGSYGRVYRAKWGQLHCVAKVFYDGLFRHNPRDHQELAKKMDKDCKYLSSIKHPNLLTYLGFIRDTKTGRLFLLMEAMDENLTRLLKRSEGPMPQERQIQICYDVALGLAYLHSINIFHRNLSSANVLLLAGRRAKVSDYGISSITNFNIMHTPKSAYMPPEALTTPPRYSDKTDTFSFGVLIVQIVSKLLSIPSSSESEEGLLGKPHVPECQRSKADVDQVDFNHPLMQLAWECLRSKDTKRPTANRLCTSLEKLRGRENGIAQSQPQVTATRNAKAEPESSGLDSSTALVFRNKLGQLLQELNDRDEQIAQKDKNIEEMEVLLREREEQVSAMEEQLQDKENIICHLQKKWKTKSWKPSPTSHHSTDQGQEAHSGSDTPHRKHKDADHRHGTSKVYVPRQYLTPPSLEWSAGGPAPQLLSAYRGSAVADGSRAYFSYINNIYSYTTATNKWIRLPECCQSYFGLAVVSGNLVAVGGIKGRQRGGEVTNALVGLTHSRLWDDILPPMPTRRAFTAAATTSKHLVVVGGSMAEDDDGVTTVESLDLESLQWSTASSLPVALKNPQLVVCKNDLYALDAESCHVYTCSVKGITSQTVLIDLSLTSDEASSSKCQPLQVAAQATSTHDGNGSSWKRMCSLQAKGGVRLLSEGGKVLVLGGHDYKLQPKGTVAFYNQESNTWKWMGQLARPKWGFLVVTLSNRILVVGGNVSAQESCESTDIASLNFEP